MSVKKITFAIVVAAVVTIGLIAGNHSFASPGAGANSLEGSWIVRLATEIKIPTILPILYTVFESSLRFLQICAKPFAIVRDLKQLRIGSSEK